MAVAALAANAYAAAAQKYGGQALAPKPPLGGANGQDTSFSGLLSQAMSAMGQTGQAADTAAMNATAGHSNMIDIVTAVAESETAMQTLVGVRDRVIAAYQQIMQMPI